MTTARLHPCNSCSSLTHGLAGLAVARHVRFKIRSSGNLKIKNIFQNDDIDDDHHHQHHHIRILGSPETRCKDPASEALTLLPSPAVVQCPPAPRIPTWTHSHHAILCRRGTKKSTQKRIVIVRHHHHHHHPRPAEQLYMATKIGEQFYPRVAV